MTSIWAFTLVGLCLRGWRMRVLAGGWANAGAWVENMFIFMHLFRVWSGMWSPLHSGHAASSPFWPQSVLGSADSLLAASIPLPGAKGPPCYSQDLMSTGALPRQLVPSPPDWSLGTLIILPLWLPPKRRPCLFCSQLPKTPVWRSFCSHHHQQPHRTQLEDQGSSAITNNWGFPLPFGLSLRLLSSEAWCIKILTRFVL